MKLEAKWMSLLTVGTLLSLSTLAVAGGRTSGGGDSRVLEFTQLARGALHLMELSTNCTHPELSPEQLKKAIDTTRVVGVDTLTLEENGVTKEVEAINHPGEGLIELNRRTWDMNRTQQQRLMALSLHEYLNVIGLDDNRYQVSSKILQCLHKDIRLAVNTRITGLEEISLQAYTLEDLKLGQAIISGDVNAARQALGEGGSVNASFYVFMRKPKPKYESIEFLTALSLAAVQDNSDMIKFLVEMDAPLEKGSAVNDFRSPLFFAIHTGSLNAVTTLIDLGASYAPGLQLPLGSALAYAVQWSTPAVVRTLLNVQADPCVNIARNFGSGAGAWNQDMTILDIARYNQNWAKQRWNPADDKIIAKLIKDAQKKAGCYVSFFGRLMN